MSALVAALEGVSVFRENGPPVLDAVDLSLAAGERVALVGANGAGKTTLLRVLLGLHAAQAGTVRPAITGGGYVPQAYADSLFPWFSVLRNLAMPRLAGEREGAVALDEARDLCRALLPDVDPGRRAGGLSGGEKQAVTIARALCARGEVLVADEPFSALSVSARDRVRALLRERLGGRALLLVTHDAGDAAALCERTVLLRGGRVSPDWQRSGEAGPSLPPTARYSREAS